MTVPFVLGAVQGSSDILTGALSLLALLVLMFVAAVVALKVGQKRMERKNAKAWAADAGVASLSGDEGSGGNDWWTALEEDENVPAQGSWLQQAMKDDHR